MRTNDLRKARRSPLFEQLLYRRPMRVSEIHVFPRCRETPAYPVCPRCASTMECEYTAFCSCCGQKLGWQHYQHARIVYVEPDQGAVHLEDPVCPR